MTAPILLPHAGRVLLFGQDTERTDPAVLLALRRKLGVVLKQDGLLPAWTGLENLELPLRYHRLLDEADIQQRIRTLCERYELPARWLDQPVAGQQHRVEKP